MISTLSPGLRKRLATMTSYRRLCVKDSIGADSIVPSRLIDWDFFANTTGTLKYCAAIAAMPMPDASIVRMRSTLTSANRRLNSLPISLNSSMSIWWLRKLSTLSTLPSLITPSFLIRSFKSSMLSLFLVRFVFY